MRIPCRHPGRWLLVACVGPVISLAWACLVLASPYPPSLPADPLPPRVLAFNSFADSSYVLSLGLVPSRAIRCGNALDLDLAPYIQQETLRLLSVHALGSAACVLLSALLISVRWPRRIRVLSWIILGALALLWGTLLVSGADPTGPLDIPCRVLAWATVFLVPVCSMIVISSGWWALRAARGGASGP